MLTRALSIRPLSVAALAIIGCALLGPLSAPPSAIADGTGDDGSRYGADADGDTITAIVELPDAVVPGTSGSSSGGCHWRYYSFSPDASDDPFARRAMYREHPVTGRLQLAVDRVCDNDVIGIGWVDAEPPTATDMLAGPRAEVSRRLPPPIPDLDPSSDATVNLGMWLAVRPLSPVTATAIVGGHRASVTATHASTVFTMGDGAVVRCAGHGTPLAAGDPRRGDPGPGPCGHTYHRPTPDDRPYVVMVTAEWSVVGVTPHGRRDLGVLTTSSTTPMTVREVQTIGRG
jgi:predicted small lipoprotein YifL